MHSDLEPCLLFHLCVWDLAQQVISSAYAVSFSELYSSCILLGLAILSHLISPLWLICEAVRKLFSLFDVVSRFIGFFFSPFHTGGKIDVSVVFKLSLCYSHVKSFTFLICETVMNVSRRHKMFRNLMEIFFQGYLVAGWSVFALKTSLPIMFSKQIAKLLCTMFFRSDWWFVCSVDWFCHWHQFIKLVLNIALPIAFVANATKSVFGYSQYIAPLIYG